MGGFLLSIRNTTSFTSKDGGEGASKGLVLFNLYTWGYLLVRSVAWVTRSTRRERGGVRAATSGVVLLVRITGITCSFFTGIVCKPT